MISSRFLFILFATTAVGAARFGLIDADTNQEVLELCGATSVDISTLPLSINFEVSGVSVPASLEILGDDSLATTWVESFPPLAYFGDVSGDFIGRSGYKPGVYTLVANQVESCTFEITGGVTFKLVGSSIDICSQPLSFDDLPNEINFRTIPRTFFVATGIDSLEGSGTGLLYDEPRRRSVPGTLLLSADGGRQTCSVVIDYLHGVVDFQWSPGGISLSQGDGFMIDELPDPINIRVVTQGPVSRVETARAIPNGNWIHNRTRTKRPFLIYDKSQTLADRYPPKANEYKVIATAFDFDGNKINTVIQSIRIDDMQFFWTGANGQKLRIVDGSTFSMSQLPDPFNIVAESVRQQLRLQREKRTGAFTTRTDKSRPYEFLHNSQPLESRYSPGTYRLRADEVEISFVITDGISSGSWTDVSMEGTPRHEGAFVECGGKFYNIGGRGNRVTDVYDPQTDTWTTAKRIGEISHFQPVCIDDVIYIVNALVGFFPSEQPLNKVLTIDTANPNVLIEGRFVPSARRRGSSAVVVYDDCIYAVGGITLGHLDGTNTLFDKYCPTTNQWFPPLPEPVYARDHISAAVLDDKLFVAGGRISDWVCGSGGCSSGADDEVGPIEWYDFLTGTWSMGAALPEPRAGAGVVAYHNLILVIGGESSRQNPAHNENNAYDYTTDTWYTLAPLNQRRHATTAFVYDDKVWIMSGSPHVGGRSETELTALEFFSF